MVTAHCLGYAALPAPQCELLGLSWQQSLPAPHLSCRLALSINTEDSPSSLFPGGGCFVSTQGALFCFNGYCERNRHTGLKQKPVKEKGKGAKAAGLVAHACAPGILQGQGRRK